MNLNIFSRLRLAWYTILILAWLAGVLFFRYFFCPIFGHRLPLGKNVKGDMTEIEFCRRCFR